MNFLRLLQFWRKPKDQPDSPRDDRISRGASGERFAERELKRAGCKIIARDVKDKHGQLDLVVRPPEGGVAVVEVRASKRADQGRDLDMLPHSKQQQVIRTARRLLVSRKLWQRGQNLRFDAVFVQLDERGKAISARHIPNAFQATQRDWF